MRKWVVLSLMKNHLLRCWGDSFSSKLDWSYYMVFTAKTLWNKLGAMIHSIIFFPTKVAFYLFSIN